MNIGQIIVFLILVLVATAGLLYMFYSRSNAVEKTGSGALIMLAIVAIMIPVFWIVDGSQQVTAKSEQFSTGVRRGMYLYAQYCTFNCYKIQDNKVMDLTYNGYTFAALNQMKDEELHRVIAAGVYNPAAKQQPQANQIISSQDFGGPLSATDIEYLYDFIRSTDKQYLQKNGYSSSTASQGVPQLLSYVQSNYQSTYATAVAFGKVGQFGEAIDKSNTTDLTINIVDKISGRTCNPACYEFLNVKVKVGTKITWVNKSSSPHTVSAIQGDGSNTSKLAPNIFDSGNSASKQLQTNGTFTHTVSKADYNFNSNHTVVYYCQIHPDMLAELTITQ